MGHSEAYLASLSVQPTLVERIKLSQVDDPHLKKIMDEVRSGKKSKFSISEDGALRFGSRLSMLNDPLIKKEILEEAHYSPYTIHMGSTKMYHDLHENFWWNNMKREIAHFVEQCLTCQQGIAPMTLRFVATTSYSPMEVGENHYGLCFKIVEIS